MSYDSDTFRRRASTLPGDESADAEVAGHLALALAAIERRRAANPPAADESGDKPILFQE